MTPSVFLILTALLAIGVEMVEALTIVLAVAVPRSKSLSRRTVGAARATESESRRRPAAGGRRGGVRAHDHCRCDRPLTAEPRAREYAQVRRWSLLASVGTFRSAEGDWAGNDASLVGILPRVLIASLTMTRLLRRRRELARVSPDPAGARA